jgi:hypothetical protein
MKVFVNLLVLALLVISVQATKHLMIKTAQGCRTKVGASIPDMEKLAMREPAETDIQKCLLSCVWGGMNVVSISYPVTKHILLQFLPKDKRFEAQQRGIH